MVPASVGDKAIPWTQAENGLSAGENQNLREGMRRNPERSSHRLPPSCETNTAAGFVPA